MRLKEGKELVTIIDFGDDYSYGSVYQKINYLRRHFLKRALIYKKRKFPYKSFTVKL